MARVLVTEKNLDWVLSTLSTLEPRVIALDTETYGLKWNDPMFALQLAVKDGDSFYFNFNEATPPALSKNVLKNLRTLWINSNNLWVMANAKFDMRRLEIEGIRLNGDIYDVLLMARIQQNNHILYSLDACLKRIGESKNDKVGLWIKDNKAYTMVEVAGKKTKEKLLHYDRVPLDLMVEYGFDDVEGTLKLYEHQTKYFNLPSNIEQRDLVASNMELTKTVYDMESRGICIDEHYCRSRVEMLELEAKSIIKQISEMAGEDYDSGPKWLGRILQQQGIKLELSEKGNAVLDSDALEKYDNAICSMIVLLREREKEISFYESLLRFSIDGVIHTNFRINGTDTLRFSSSDPNLQNIPACSKGNLFTVRSSFVPRDGFNFVSIDYSSMEFRLCVDYAGQDDMIEAIDKGLDPHQMVADNMGSDRKTAKTLNFLTLYGGGAGKLAGELGCDLYQARKYQQDYYNALPKVRKLHSDVQSVSIHRGYVKNQFGMRYHLNDSNYAYKMVNHLIQGTGACIIRSAMNKLAYVLEGMKSKMILQIHDELIFEVHKDEMFIVPEIKRIMEAEWKPLSGMKMKCDVAVSTKNWNENNFVSYEQYMESL